MGSAGSLTPSARQPLHVGCPMGDAPPTFLAPLWPPPLATLPRSAEVKQPSPLISSAGQITRRKCHVLRGYHQSGVCGVCCVAVGSQSSSCAARAFVFHLF